MAKETLRSARRTLASGGNARLRGPGSSRRLLKQPSAGDGLEDGSHGSGGGNAALLGPLAGPGGPHPAPDHTKRGEDGNREEHPDGAADLSARDDTEDHDGGMELDAAPHHERARDVVLDAAPYEHEGHQK